MTTDTSAEVTQVLKGLAHRAAVLLAVVGGSALAGAALIGLSWRGDLPARIAVSWNADGVASGFGSLGENMAMLLGIAALMLAGCVLVCWRWGTTASTRRLAVGAGVGVSLALGAQFVAGLAVQRGAAVPQGVTMNEWLVIALVVLGGAVGVGAALLLPGDPPQPATTPVAPDVARLPLAATERAVWIGTARAGIAISVVFTALGAGTIVFAVVMRTWGAVAPLPLVLLVLATMFRFRVRVDATGLTVRSAAGYPRTHIPAAEVLGAETVRINPLMWGGWGWRVRGDGAAVITRAGEGLLVRRTGGRSFRVTCDDAAAAAALLNTMADRAR